MRVNREDLLKTLESVTPGLALKENVDQSSCLVFLDGKVCTFNEEIAARRKSPLNIEGAVKAKTLLDLLAKQSSEDVDLEKVEKEEGGVELHVSGKGFKTGLRFEAEVLLPISSVEEPGEWKSLPDDFVEAVSFVSPCASSDIKKNWLLTCVNVTAKHMEATDRYQIARYMIELPLEKQTLVRAETLVKLAGYDMTEISESQNWLHFRNPAGLEISIRRFLDDSYRSLDPFIDKGDDDTAPLVLPGGLDEMVNRAQIFSEANAVGNKVLVDLRDDRVIIEGEGANGWYKERKMVKYEGRPIRFIMAPKMLISTSKKGNEVSVGSNRLFVEGSKFKYVTSTEVEKKTEETV